MNQNFFNITSRVFIITLLGTFLSAQQLDSQDIVYNELREIVENASRTNQKVWLKILLESTEHTVQMRVSQ